MPQFWHTLYDNSNFRWNSSYFMINSYVELKPALVQTLANLEDVDTEFNNQEWQLMEKIQRTLQPLEEATRLLSKFEASISMVIPLVTTILKSLEDTREDRGVLTWRRDLRENIKTRFSSIESNTHYTAATLLDSRYKHYLFRNPITYPQTKEYIVERMARSLTQEFHQVNTMIHWPVMCTVDKANR